MLPKYRQAIVAEQMKPLILTAAILSAIAGAWLHGNTHGVKTERLEWQSTQQKAYDTALQAEREARNKADETHKIQVAAQRSINDRLTADLERLRNRPKREQMPSNSTAECRGANGPELAREHAEFLTRYAAKAAEQDAGLAACISQYNDVKRLFDGLQSKSQH